MKTIKNAKYPALIGAILAGLLIVEGGYVNHPTDPGGETNYGITKEVAAEHGYTGPMESLPKAVAMDIYATTYISKPKFDKVLEISEPVGIKLIDAGVNTGYDRATKWYQQSLNSFSRGCKDYSCIGVDGIIGPATLNAHKKLIEKRGEADSCRLLLRGINTFQGKHYMNLTSLSTFNVGWFLHRINNVKEDSCED